MITNYSSDIFYGHLIKGDLTSAMAYLSQFPEQADSYRQYESLFCSENYLEYDLDPFLNAILKAYQRYFREVFYLQADSILAENHLLLDLKNLFNIYDPNTDLAWIEDKYVHSAFHRQGLHFLGGRTSGFYGPYIWQTTESHTYAVELPQGIQHFTVNFLDGFIVNSWLDYLSFGAVSTGGWTDPDGIINCVRSSYDLQDERFSVSLLKHEAQHAADLKQYPGITSADLEYRAKLVELIYTQNRNLLQQFVHEADDRAQSNGHSIAASRIISEMGDQNSVAQIQLTAKYLFEISTKEMISKYL